MMNMKWVEGRANATAQVHAIQEASPLRRTKKRKGGGSWDDQGSDATVRRCHSTWRRSLFTPMKIKGGPADGDALDPLRVTAGVTRSGRKFVIKDNLKSLDRAHLVLEEDWTGHTVFFLRPGATRQDNYQ